MPGLWLLGVNVVAVALGADWYSLVMAVFGAGAFLVGAVAARRARLRAGLSRE